jgi:hypothetical protein
MSQVVKLGVLEKSEGLSQLDNLVEKAETGEWVQLAYIGLVGRKEFVDTYHHGSQGTPLKAKFQIDSKTNEGLFVGLSHCAKQMKLGEMAKFQIPHGYAFGEQGLSRRLDGIKGRPLGNHENRNPIPFSYMTIEPRTDLILEVQFMNVYRDGAWQIRKPKGTKCGLGWCCYGF